MRSTIKRALVSFSVRSCPTIRYASSWGSSGSLSNKVGGVVVNGMLFRVHVVHMQTNDDLGRVVLADRLAREPAFGSVKFSADDFAEPLSHLVSEDVTLTCVAARVGNFPGQRVLVFDNLRRVLRRLQGRQRSFQALSAS